MADFRLKPGVEHPPNRLAIVRVKVGRGRQVKVRVESVDMGANRGSILVNAKDPQDRHRPACGAFPGTSPRLLDGVVNVDADNGCRKGIAAVRNPGTESGQTLLRMAFHNRTKKRKKKTVEAVAQKHHARVRKDHQGIKDACRVKGPRRRAKRHTGTRPNAFPP